MNPITLGCSQVMFLEHWITDSSKISQIAQFQSRKPVLSKLCHGGGVVVLPFHPKNLYFARVFEKKLKILPRKYLATPLSGTLVFWL